MIVRDMILPNCVWHAGRTAAAVRKAAVACLWALIRTPTITNQQVGLRLHAAVSLMGAGVVTEKGELERWVSDFLCNRNTV